MGRRHLLDYFESVQVQTAAGHHHRVGEGCRVYGGDGESTWAYSPGEPAGTRQRACASAQEDSTLPALLCSHDLLSSLPITGSRVLSRAIPEPHKPPGTWSLWALQKVDPGPLILQQPLRFQSPRSYTHTIWQPVCRRSTAPPPQPHGYCPFLLTSVGQCRLDRVGWTHAARACVRTSVRHRSQLSWDSLCITEAGLLHFSGCATAPRFSHFFTQFLQV